MSVFSSQSPTTVQPHIREIIAPADCTGFTAEQERALDIAASRWIAAQGTLAEDTLRAIYNELRREYQRVNMLKAL